MNRISTGAAALLPLMMLASAASAETPSSAITVTPLLDARLRYEQVDQGSLDADALTLRVRAGAEAKTGALSLLAEVEGTAALSDDYNAFPFVIADEQRRPGFAVVADPKNLEINRLQLRYKNGSNALTLGRQRITLDDQRFVGACSWRQNEQTFDGVRGEAKVGPLNADVTYVIHQRTILGADAGPRAQYDGNFVFAGVGGKSGPIQAKLFAYLLDYDEAFYVSSSSQTYGGYVAGAVPVGGKTKLDLRASYARQSNYKRNPSNYAADYWSFEGGTTLAGFSLTGGWERLGSDNGRAVQTPMASLHKFNGWADLFLTTPAAGLEDAYIGIARKFDGVKALPGLNASLTVHQFDSHKGKVEYGSEWNASVGLTIGKVGVLAKYADYDAVGFGTDTRKLWLQAEIAL